MSLRFISIFDMCLNLRFSVSDTKNEPGQIITYEDMLLKFEEFVALDSEMCNNKQFKITLANYTKSNI